MTSLKIPALDAAKLADREPVQMAELRRAVSEVGFLTLTNTTLSTKDVTDLIAAYHAFFTGPPDVKAQVDMARTGGNRGWGAPQSEQVDPKANPDYKEAFDAGFELPFGDSYAARDLTVYAANQWPDGPSGLRAEIETYLPKAMKIALDLLRAIAAAVELPERYFDQAFDRPMALLRGNYYPQRPDWAGAQDYGIAPHTDYGCLTLLATDGTPGLDVLASDGTWVPVTTAPGTFVINFGEMLELWSSGRIKATEHRVQGSAAERVSVPLFFNPSYDTNVAPPEADTPVLAGDYLEQRYRETYVHLQKAG